LLLEKDADVNAVTANNETALYRALWHNSQPIVEMLIGHGADDNAVGVNGKTPLYYATIWGHDQIVDYLVENGADQNAGRSGQFAGDYLGVEPPGKTPQAFAENALLTPLAPHGSIAFSPDGREMFWCHHALPIQAMWRMTREDYTWSLPRIAPFTDPATEYSDGSPSFSADGRRLFFHSHRPLTDGGERNEDSDIWYVEKQDDGWGKPVPIGSPVNTDKGEFEPAIGASGDLYFIGSDYENSIGAGDIYVSRFIDGKYTAPRNLGPTINSESHELGPVLAPDESYMLFTSNRPYLGRPSLNLYVSFRTDDGGWTDAANLGRGINGRGSWHPCVTPDGKYIIYLQSNNYYWFSAEVIADMKRAIVEPGEEAAPSVKTPHFRKSDQVFEHEQTNNIALGDLDAVFSNMGFNDSRVYMNDGQGRFTVTEQLLTQQGHGVGMGDLDGDGDLDIFMTCAGYTVNNILYNRPSKIYLNDGKARFTDTGQDLGDSLLSGTGAHLDDIDGDGDLDAMVNYYQDANRIYLNDGHARFTKSDVTFPTMSSWGDLDNDGDVDILTREVGIGFTTLLNDGSGHFTRHWQKLDSTVIRGRSCLGDFDGDNDLDAVVTHGDHTGHNPSAVWLNDGTGRFTEIESDLLVTVWARTAFGDLNNDGFGDVFVSNMGFPSYVWFNDGRGHIRDYGIRLPTRSMNAGCALGDLDGDGDLDVFIGGFGGGPNELWFNEQ